ncbi:MAG: hypothetical protein WBK91_03330 [Alphaproteobacteria bacterium]
MQEIFNHPAFGNLTLCLLGFWPIVQVLRRVGLNPHWGWLWLLQLIVPGLGLAVMAGIFCHHRWPKLPAQPPKWRKTQIWGQS